MGDTVVLVTAVARRRPTPDRDFFPLTVNYLEKTYAAGRIPGGFFKREGRPSEKETLTSRLIDRPIRPLFPEGFYQRSAGRRDRAVDESGDRLRTSRRCSARRPRWRCPACRSRPDRRRAGRLQDGQYILNPTATQLKSRKLDLVVAGTQEAVLMVESQADGLSEEVMLGAVMFGHEQMQVAIQAINELEAEAGKPRWNWAGAGRQGAS